MSRWIPIQFGDVSNGMSTNPTNPGQKTAKRILNLQNHIKPGALVLRPGYESLYSKPECLILDNLGDPVILDMGFVNFDLFFDRQAVTDGKEITCLIQKAKVHGLTDIEETQDMLCFWVRPYWDGLAWVDEWQWLNKTIITKIVTGSDATYPNMIIVAGNASNGLTDNSLNRFTIYNKTKNEYANVITSKISGGNVRICHTLYNNQWATNDVVIISNYWLGVDYTDELFSVDWKEITFHKILNDLRIGFGGEVNRPGLMVGYRKKYSQIRKIDFPSIHADILEEGVIENFSKIDEIVLDTHILNKSSYGVILNPLPGGNLEAKPYTIRLTGILDTFEEQLIAESTITLDGTQSLEILPYIIAGTENPRLTGFGTYFSSDGITFYKVSKYNFKEDIYAAGEWKIDTQGRIILIGTSEPTIIQEFELHAENNAASSADIDSTGSWNVWNSGVVGSSPVAVDSYALKYTRENLSELDPEARAGIIFPLSNVIKGKNYSVSVYLKSTNDKLHFFFLGGSLQVLTRTQTGIAVTKEFVKYDFEVFADLLSEAPIYFAIALSPVWNIFLPAAGGEVYRSSDGLTWALANSGLPVGDFGYEILNLGQTQLAARRNPGGGDIYRSINAGNTWSIVSGPFNIVSLSMLNGKIYAGSAQGAIYRSDDNGVSFTLVNSIEITFLILSFASIGDSIFAGTSYGGVYRSLNNGANWTAVNIGITDLGITALCVNGSYLFAGTYSGGIFRSSNNGDTWMAVNTGLEDPHISSIIKKDSYLFASQYDAAPEPMRKGIFRSSNNGDTWMAVNTGIGITDLNIRDLYVYGNNILGGASNGKIFKSTDNGDNWTEMAGFPTFYTTFAKNGEFNGFSADKLSIKVKSNSLVNTLTATTEMKAELGYTPTHNLVRGWDQALSLRGRTYYLNPYIEKRHENFVLVSHIHSNGSYMYDIASFSNFRELEKFDSNEAIGIALLPTMELLILKDSSITTIDPDTGAAREPIFGVSCISRNSIVNMNGIIFWCGGEDIYVLNIGKGFHTEPLLKNTIRDLYLALSDKSSIQCVRDKHNTYRLRTYKPELKTEYVLSENGWVEEKKWHFPEIYRAGFRNKLYFLSLGNIYTEKVELDYSTIEGFVMTGEYILD